MASLALTCARTSEPDPAAVTLRLFLDVGKRTAARETGLLVITPPIPDRCFGGHTFDLGDSQYGVSLAQQVADFLSEFDREAGRTF